MITGEGELPSSIHTRTFLPLSPSSAKFLMISHSFCRTGVRVPVRIARCPTASAPKANSPPTRTPTGVMFTSDSFVSGTQVSVFVSQTAVVLRPAIGVVAALTMACPRVDPTTSAPAKGRGFAISRHSKLRQHIDLERNLDQLGRAPAFAASAQVSFQETLVVLQNLERQRAVEQRGLGLGELLTGHAPHERRIAELARHQTAPVPFSAPITATIAPEIIAMSLGVHRRPALISASSKKTRSPQPGMSGYCRRKLSRSSGGTISTHPFPHVNY